MAFRDYGAILKKNGKVVNLNQDLFMDMKEAVGFTIDPIPFQYEYKGEIHNSQQIIDGNYFVYFGDEELCFCVYKFALSVIVNKQHIEYLGFDWEENKVVKYFNFNSASVKIKKITGGKIHAKIQYKGNRYEVIYGYGIDNNVNCFKRISKDRRYGYNNKNVRYIENFLKLN